MNKQVRDAVVLIGLLVILGVIGFFVWQSNSPHKKPGGEAPPPQQAAKNNTATAEKPKSEGDKTKLDDKSLEWVPDLNEAQKVVESVKRDPFKDYLIVPPPPPPPPTSPKTTPGPTPPIGSGSGPSPGNDQTIITKWQQFNWITSDDIARLLKEKMPSVGAAASEKGPKVVIFTGTAGDVRAAIKLAQGIDHAPPPPPPPLFQLSGIISSPTTQCAIISIGGQTYSLFEGETIPCQGWIVVKITPNGVNLAKGNQSLLLRISGGKSS